MARVTPGILTRRLCGATLLAQAISIFFGALVAWGLAQADPGAQDDWRPTAYLVGGVALALLCIVAVGALRKGRLGVRLGWAVQLLTLASAVVLPAMVVIAGIFGGLWFLCLRQGQRMDEITAQREAEAGRLAQTEGEG